MSATHIIRQVHRWVSVAFTVAVIITSVAMAQEQPVVWVSCTPLPFLFLLMITGVYLFALPWVVRWRAGRKAAG